MAFDFDAAVAAPFRMQPGLRRIAPGTPLLTPSLPRHRGGARHLREKLAVLGAYASQALLAAPGFDARPALNALAEHAAVEHPAAFAIEGDTWRALRLGWAVDAGGRPLGIAYDASRDGSGEWPEAGRVLRALEPCWRRAALLSLAFADDFAVLDGDTTRIPWLAVALPSHWAPEEKIGRPFAEVHAPVADNRLIVGAAEALSRLVTAGDRWERFVWTIAAEPRLHAHPARANAAGDRWPSAWSAEALGARAFFRGERQAFLPIEGLRQAVFAIHVDTMPLADAVSTPHRAARLAAAIESMSEPVLDYRGLAPARDRLLAWLNARAGGAR